MFLSLLVLVPGVAAQADAICSEFGGGMVWANQSAVYGKVEFAGLRDPNKFPKVTVTLTKGGSTLASSSLGRSGNYCFRNINGAGGTLIVTLEDAEVGRQDLPSGGQGQFRQDFAIDVAQKLPRAGVISAKYSYKREGKNAELFHSANLLMRERKGDKAIPLLMEIVTADAKDFVVWGLIGSLHFEKNDLGAAEAAYMKALEANTNFVPAMANLGQVYMLQKKLDLAVPILEKATANEPDYARGFRLLGEAYLLAKKGTLGLQALYKAIEIDPKGMAECHLLAARLFESAGAKGYASREYKLFLEKVPEHPQKKQFQKYIQENPPADN